MPVRNRVAVTVRNNCTRLPGRLTYVAGPDRSSSPEVALTAQHRHLLIVDDLETTEYSVIGLLSDHFDASDGRSLSNVPFGAGGSAGDFRTMQVTSPLDIPSAVADGKDRGVTYDVALVDLDFGARRAGSDRAHGLTALRLLAEHSPGTKVALYTADIEGNRELMLRAAFELSPHAPETWISKAAPRPDQALAIRGLLEEHDIPFGRVRPYLLRPDHLRLRTICGTLTQLRLWQAMAIGLESRQEIAAYAHASKSTLDQLLARARAFILDCMNVAERGPDADGAATPTRSANLVLAQRFAHANRAFFSDPELEFLLQRAACGRRA